MTTLISTSTSQPVVPQEAAIPLKESSNSTTVSVTEVVKKTLATPGQNEPTAVKKATIDEIIKKANGKIETLSAQEKEEFLQLAKEQTVLNLTGFELNDPSMMSHFEKLNILKMKDCTYSAAFIEKLASIPTLKSLSIVANKPFSEGCIQSISHLANLESLSLIGNDIAFEPKDFLPLTALSKLKSLAITIKDEKALDHLKNFSALKTLRLDLRLSKTVLKGFPKLEALQELTLIGPIDDDCLRAIKELPSLSAVTINASNALADLNHFSDKGLQTLLTSNHLEKLHIVLPKDEKCRTISSECLKKIAPESLSKLKTLVLEVPRLSSRLLMPWLMSLKNVPTIEEIALRSAAKLDQEKKSSLQFLISIPLPEKFPKLQSLCLTHTTITNEEQRKFQETISKEGVQGLLNFYSPNLTLLKGAQMLPFGAGNSIIRAGLKTFQAAIGCPDLESLGLSIPEIPTLFQKAIDGVTPFYQRVSVESEMAEKFDIATHELLGK